MSPEGEERTPPNTFREHKIRIAVNGEDNFDKFVTNELNSCASVSVIECDRADDHRNIPKPKKSENEVKNVCVINQDRIWGYNEKAIDVPKDFEERAYEHLPDRPFVRSFNKRKKLHVKQISFFLFISLIE